MVKSMKEVKEEKTWIIFFQFFISHKLFLKFFCTTFKILMAITSMWKSFQHENYIMDSVTMPLCFISCGTCGKSQFTKQKFNFTILFLIYQLNWDYETQYLIFQHEQIFYSLSVEIMRFSSCGKLSTGRQHESTWFNMNFLEEIFFYYKEIGKFISKSDWFLKRHITYISAIKRIYLIQGAEDSFAVRITAIFFKFFKRWKWRNGGNC